MVKTSTDLSKLKVAELKDLLQKKKLSTAGTKAILISRLQAADKKSSKKKVQESSEEESSEEVVQKKSSKKKTPSKKTDTKKTSSKKKSSTKKVESSEDESSEEVVEKKTKKTPAKKTRSKKASVKKAKKEESEVESSEDESSEEVVEKKTKKSSAKKASSKKTSAKKVESSSEGESEEKSSSEGESEDKSSEEVVEKKAKNVSSKKTNSKKKTSAKKVESSDEESSEVVEKKSSKKDKKVVESSDESEKEEDNSESSEEEPVSKTKAKKSTKASKKESQPLNEVYKVTTEELLAVFEALKNSKNLAKDLVKKMKEYKIDIEGEKEVQCPQEDIEVESEDAEPLKVQYDEKLKVYTNGLWVFDIDEKKAFAKVKKGKIIALTDQDLEILEDPPIENMGVLSKDKLQKMIAKQAIDKDEESEGDDDGKDIVEKVEDGVKDVMNEPEITEEDFLKYMKAQEDVEHKADYVAVSKAAGIDENIGRFIALQFVALKEKYAKALTNLKTKKSEGRKLRKK
jgi:hypothetical protein